MKERYQLSEMRKQANRMTFGEVCPAHHQLVCPLIPTPPLHPPLTPLLCPPFLQIEEDAYQDDLGFSMGQMGKSSTGRVRGPAVDQKTQVTISKRLQVCYHWRE